MCVGILGYVWPFSYTRYLQNLRMSATTGATYVPFSHSEQLCHMTWSLKLPCPYLGWFLHQNPFPQLLLTTLHDLCPPEKHPQISQLDSVLLPSASTAFSTTYHLPHHIRTHHLSHCPVPLGPSQDDWTELLPCVYHSGSESSNSLVFISHRSHQYQHIFIQEGTEQLLQWIIIPLLNRYIY